MLRVGLIGAGGIAGVHALSYENIKDVKIVAVADIIPEKAEYLAKKFGADVLDHGDKIIAREDIDVVDVCLPTYLHHEYVLKAARAGKHVLCEKPMALTVEQGIEMIKETEKAGVKFMTGHVLRFFPEYVNAKEVIESGSIGTPKVVRGYRGGVHPSRVTKWYGEVEKSGGAIQDMLVHDIDFLRWCFGPVKQVYAKGNVYKRVEYLEYDMLTLEFESGLIAHLTADWSKPEGGSFVTRLEIAGTEGILSYESDKEIPLNVICQVDKTSAGGGVAVPESPLDPLSVPFTREIMGFMNAVSKDEETPIQPVEALRTLSIALAALESIRENKPVLVKEVF